MSAKDKAGSRAAAKGRAASQGKAASTGNFAEDANAAAKAVTRGPFGEPNTRKVFIADAYAIYAKTHPHVSLLEFKEKLVGEMRKGTVVLSRTDLVEAIPAHMKQTQHDSQITFHQQTGKMISHPTASQMYNTDSKDLIRWNRNT